MSATRNSAAALARVFSLASSPVYAVDDQRQIVYANEACAEWLRISTDSLVGQRCDYHSQMLDDPAAEAAATLCPPPEVFAGERTRARLTIAGGVSDEAARVAEFIPIGDTPSSCVGVIAIVHDDVEVPVANQNNAGHHELHSLLFEFRRMLGDHYALDHLAGNSPARARVRSQTQLAATTDAAVLIVGPRGSGRQHAARTIHVLSGSQARIVPLDCNVAPQGLVEHVVARASLEERRQSERDVLLLVDVDRLPSDGQATLAERLADESTDYRVIATSTEALDRLAEQGRFREDLACRLSVLTIELPSLRELSEDIPLLAQWFLEAENARGEKQLAGFSEAAMEMLLTYHWPGNLDELADVVHLAHRAAGDSLVEPDDLSQRLRMAADAAIQGDEQVATIDLDALLREIEMRLVREALAAADGNKSRAAKQLGMTRQRLYRRLVQLGLENNPDEDS